MSQLSKRLEALERANGGGSPLGAQTAASIIAALRQRPARNADEFFIWEQSLTDAERVAYQAAVDTELASWREGRELWPMWGDVL